jgi:hypothetical protein
MHLGIARKPFVRRAVNPMRSLVTRPDVLADCWCLLAFCELKENLQLYAFAPIQLKAVFRRVRGTVRGRRVEMHLSSAKHPIGAGITQDQNSVVPLRFVFSSDLLGMQSSDLKYVFEMGFELERERQLMRFDVVVIDRDYVVHAELVSVDDAPQVDTKGLNCDGFSVRNLELLICEFEFGNGSPVCRCNKDVRRSTSESYAVAVKVPAIVVVKAEAVLIVGGNLAILLRKEEQVGAFGYNGSRNIPGRSRRVNTLSHIALRYIILMQTPPRW